MFALRQDLAETRVRPTIDCGPGRTKQYMRDETNINLIMDKYQKTGLVDFVSRRQPEYMETEPVDFQNAMNTVIEAQNLFSELPSSIRKKFQNNPSEFYDFVSDPSNTEEIYNLGLATRPVQPPEPAQGPENSEPPTPSTPVE